MSLDDILFEKIEKMDREQAIEILFSVLLTAEEWERRSQVIDRLIQFKDQEHFSEKSFWLSTWKTFTSNQERLLIMMPR